MKHSYNIHFLLSVLALLLTCHVSINAEPISKAQALKLASQYVHKPILKKSTAQTRAIDNEKNPAFYLFDNAKEKGFVIISGESKMNSLVAYSDEGEMDNVSLPDPMVDLLKNYTAIVKEVRQGKRKVIIPKLKKYVAVEPLIKTNWGQQAPYNFYTPLEKSQRTLTGCVATAMSQIMYFHQWPKKRYKDAPKEKEELSQLKDSYDWDLMLTDYKRGYKMENGSAVATLMRDAGTAVKMQYSLNASGSYVQDAVWALRDSFQYDVKYLLNSGMSANVYREELMEELSKGYPVFGKGGAHAWVYDGYNEDGLVHVNWGWNGYYNGYFDLSVIGVSSVGDGGGDGKYWTDPEMILLRPRDGKHELFNERPKRLTFFYDGSISFKYNRLNKRYGLTAELRNVGTTSVKKDDTGAFKGYIGVAFYNEKDSLVKIIQAYSTTLKWDNVYQSYRIRDWNWRIDDLKPGTYRVVPVSKALLKEPNEYGEWLSFENAPEVKLLVDELNVTVISPTSSPVFKLQDTPNFITNVYEKGLQTGRLNFSVLNISGKEYRGSLKFKLTGNQRTFEYEPPQSKAVSVIQRNGISQLTLSLPSIYDDEGIRDTLSAGKYKMTVQFVYRDDVANQYIYNIEGLQDIEIEVLPTPTQALLSIEKMQFYINKEPSFLQEINREANNEVALSMDLKLTKVGEKTSCKGDIIYSAEDLETGEFTDLGRVQNVEITSKDGKTADKTKAILNLSTLKEHKIYQLYAYLEAQNTRVQIGINSDTPRYFTVYGTPAPTGIESLKSFIETPLTIYSLQGVRLQSTWNMLPTGIYIVNGKKVYKH